MIWYFWTVRTLFYVFYVLSRYHIKICPCKNLTSHFSIIFINTFLYLILFFLLIISFDQSLMNIKSQNYLMISTTYYYLLTLLADDIISVTFNTLRAHCYNIFELYLNFSVKFNELNFNF